MANDVNLIYSPHTKAVGKVAANYQQIKKAFELLTSTYLILSSLKTIPEGVLTKEDRKKRRAKIREDFAKLPSTDSGKIAFDVSELLRENLGL